ncbi:MAG TPA: response regulator transcription factor [Epsilonproteobacteria bacterium]|nr:response regulator transcription factor [Campylobacterota bacterium]
MKNRILLLEDDAALHETLKEYLEDSGIDVVGVYNGAEAEEAIYENSFDVLILDVNVPYKNGFDVLKNARKEGIQTPAVFLTSRDGLEDVETGFSSGADDYIRKPFALKELLLRVNTILLRRFSHTDSNQIDLGNGFSYDMQFNSLFRDGENIKLADKPGRLLSLLLQYRGKVVTHEVLMAHLWNYDEVPSDDALRTYIKILRAIFGKDRIVSHKRTGYQFR